VKELLMALDASWGYDLECTIPWLLEPMRKVIVKECRAVVACEVDLGEVAGGLAMIPFWLQVCRRFEAIVRIMMEIDKNYASVSIDTCSTK
jgi:hypothetical protein